MKNQILVLVIALCVLMGGAQAFAQNGMSVSDTVMPERPDDYPSAIFGGGCFWCVESEFRKIDGVLFTRVGYAGGALDYPSYRDVSTGESGHAEVVEIVYDPAVLSYRDLVVHFLTQCHDPTQLDKQGVDIGPQYRSVIFYQDDMQQIIAREVMAQVDASGQYDDQLVTDLKPYEPFWEAEEHHQQYYEKYEEEMGRPHIRVLLKDK